MVASLLLPRVASETEGFMPGLVLGQLLPAFLSASPWFIKPDCWIQPRVKAGVRAVLPVGVTVTALQPLAAQPEGAQVLSLPRGLSGLRSLRTNILFLLYKSCCSVLCENQTGKRIKINK